MLTLYTHKMKWGVCEQEGEDFKPSPDSFSD